MEQEPQTAHRALDASADREAILEQLERIVSSPLFRNSKRYPALLRHVVERTLDGRTAELKERTLGVDVLHRDADYDTNLDPAVRVTAGEVRKRLSQYYQELEHENEIRIELPPGSYVPEFQRKYAVAPVVEMPPRRPRPKRPVYGAAGCAVLLAAALAWWRPWTPAPPLETYWKPVLQSSGPVLLCMGQRRDGRPNPQAAPNSNAAPPAADSADAALSLFQLYRTTSQNVALPDVLTLARIAGLLQTHGKSYQIRAESSATLSDLRGGPVVLIGGFNNDWTMRLLSGLRFSLGRDGDVFFVSDRETPARRNWSVDYSLPYTRVTDDYALVSRVLDPRTARMLIVIAGLAGYGTMAAGEALTSPDYLAAIAARAPAGWERRNLQAVIATKVINGNSGPPRVLATYSW
jgi:hypothetical protein